MSYVDRKHFMLDIAIPKQGSPLFAKIRMNCITALFPHIEVITHDGDVIDVDVDDDEDEDDVIDVDDVITHPLIHCHSSSIYTHSNLSLLLYTSSNLLYYHNYSNTIP